MTTPRIEEMVEKYADSYRNILSPEAIERSKDYWRSQLLEARQVGINEANCDYKSLEASWMALKDDYSEICRALGFEGDAWFGDPLAKHEDIVARAKALQAKK